jgi:hypothetical protein
MQPAKSIVEFVQSRNLDSFGGLMFCENSWGIRTTLWDRAIRSCTGNHESTCVGYQARQSELECINMIWRGCADADALPLCPADVHWYLRFLRRSGKIILIAHGPTTQATLVDYQPGDEFLGIRFKLGTFLPMLAARSLVNSTTVLVDAVQNRFELWGTVCELPTYDNADILVSRLLKAGTLRVDPVIDAALHHQEQERTQRSIQQRFIHAAGLSYKIIQQVERARYAAALLAEGTPIMQVVFQAGYFDHPHLTRSLKRFLDKTPAQIARPSR